MSIDNGGHVEPRARVATSRAAPASWRRLTRDSRYVEGTVGIPLSIYPDGESYMPSVPILARL
jgi:hypothetical protein